MTTGSIRAICSMATRGLMQELAQAYARRNGVPVAVTPVGGVEAAQRVLAGEAFDLVVLASDAIDKLAAAGKVDPADKVELVRSGIGAAVRAGVAPPDIGSEDALRRAALGAERVAYSTGPSGNALLALFKRWGIAGDLQGRLLQAPPGVPVGSLVARGEAALGFQQQSELIGLAGITLLGPLPAQVQVVTVFSGAPIAGSARVAPVRTLLQFMQSPACDEAKRRHGMEPA